ncbi:MAG TPA: hypothetical protein VE152_10415, partial [Acidimicrobiales bacterium]|nr:hypothetical protein [Acidimicrobiales bacterium]
MPKRRAIGLVTAGRKAGRAVAGIPHPRRAARLPVGTVRFAEFFEIDHGRIRSLRLLYDAGAYTAS